MKRLISILLSLFLLISSISGAVNIHYCAGQFASVSILPDNSSCCCGEEESDDCCDNELLIIQAEQQQQLIQNFELGDPIAFANVVENNWDVHLPVFTSSEKPATTLEPPPSQRPLWLINCSLVYYS